MLRLPFDQVHGQLRAALLKLGFDPARADQCARLLTETTCDGVYSHGINRFPRFIRTIQNGMVHVEARAECAGRLGAVEQWEGNRGPGNLNAWACMGRAIELAREHTIGCVALRNTNHWMRGGTYGWQAADAGMAGLCWTNTMPNLPPWGGLEQRLGNNPLVVAVPHEPEHVVLDMAVSQYSYGALEGYRKRGEPLPVAGGFDAEGQLSADATAILKTRRLVPAGFWKGSGLSLVLDLLAALLSAGNAVCHIDPDPLRESAVSQVFVAFDVARTYPGGTRGLVDEVLQFTTGGRAADPDHPVIYPGERVLRIRAENLEKGIPIEEDVLKEIESLIP